MNKLVRTSIIKRLITFFITFLFIQLKAKEDNVWIYVNKKIADSSVSGNIEAASLIAKSVKQKQADNLVEIIEVYYENARDSQIHSLISQLRKEVSQHAPIVMVCKKFAYDYFIFNKFLKTKSYKNEGCGNLNIFNKDLLAYHYIPHSDFFLIPTANEIREQFNKPRSTFKKIYDANNQFE